MSKRWGVIRGMGNDGRCERAIRVRHIHIARPARVIDTGEGQLLTVGRQDRLWMPFIPVRTFELHDGFSTAGFYGDPR